MTVQMRRCRACGAEVVWLPSGRGLGGWVLVEPRELRLRMFRRISSGRGGVAWAWSLSATRRTSLIAAWSATGATTSVRLA
jgi:hypothetical protein